MVDDKKGLKIDISEDGVSSQPKRGIYAIMGTPLDTGGYCKSLRTIK